MKKYNYEFLLNGFLYTANVKADNFKNALKIKKQMKDERKKSKCQYKQIGRLQRTLEFY